jgi:hypothetical protein
MALIYNELADWDANSKRATKIHFRGEVQCVTSRDFSEFKCEIPPNLRVHAECVVHPFFGIEMVLV